MPIAWDSIAVIAAFTLGGGWLGARTVAALAPRALPLSVSIAACGVLSVWTFHIVFGTTPLLLSLCLGWVLLFLAIIDWMEFRLPDVLTLPLIAGGLVAAALLPAEDVLDPLTAPGVNFVLAHTVPAMTAVLRSPAEHVLEHAAAATMAYAMLWIIAWAFRYLRGRDGLGLGDVKLIAAAGAWLGFGPLPSVLLIASLAGIVWILVAGALQGRKALSQRIAFGIPLAFAIWIVWLYEPLSFADMQ